jgi:hypothetical protein
MVKRNKAFVKTLEIFLVIIFTTLFLMVLLQKQFSSSTLEKERYLVELEKETEFRNYLSQNTGCFGSSTSSSGYIREYLPSRFDYILCINTRPEGLPEKEVYSDSLFFTGNITSVQSKIIKLYYWIIS